MDRLEKILAQTGIASRRRVKSLIADGRVTVDGQEIRNPGSRVDPTSIIAVDGREIELTEPKITILMNKPTGVVCTVDDPQHRQTILDIAPVTAERIYPVGRLDRQSSGALLLTNDGELFQALTLPDNHCPKTYEVLVQGHPKETDFQRLRDGVLLDGRRTRPATVELVEPGAQSRCRVILTEGRNNQIRRMFDLIGYPVDELTRTHIAFLSVEGLAAGRYRHLSDNEISRLKSHFLSAPQ